ncbi:kinase-like domain-containing protein [Dactylonectria estremocensis]|uniref:Kinase-like domain-containing protein n=1 Tax=Dactylonectria estremocensis TaxID=1079267 RepID=A0A9P9DJY0_9HYPO|nr:kinase-like domain-containing protein [Dactylonectria estremocensis]
MMSAPAARATPLDLSYLENHGFLELHDGGNEQLHRHIWSNGRHDGLDSKVVRHGGVAEAIRVALELAEIPDITRVNEFVPLDSFGRIINKTTISQLLRELKSCKTMSSSKREQLANEICSTTPQHSCRKVVAALIRIKKEEEIPNIVQEGFRDDCLPLHLLTDTQLYHRQTSRTCESMRKWNPKERRKYWKASQKFSCPVFMRPPGKVCHYVLYEPVRLPFEEEVQSFEERDSDFGAANGNGGDEEAGGYGAVARVRIHAGHHNFGDYGPRLDDNVFAVKTLTTTDRRVFADEVAVLLRFAHRKDKQLVKLLATYEIRKAKGVTFHLIFPWADWSVRTLWREVPVVDRTNASCIQLITKEVAAIASSLAFIHNEYAKDLDPRDKEQYGRHGDIKGANLLVYRTRASGSDQWQIFVADFGLSRFHRQQSRSMVHPKATSPSYRPPEFDLPNGTLSRKSDIWSLGAFYLEHLTWFLEGWKAVETGFPEFREVEDYQGVLSDTFFHIVMQGSSRKAIVKPEVTEWIILLHQHRGATQYIHDLLDLIEKRMLVVDRESRIEASHLKVQLQDMCQRCISNRNYCTQGVPRRYEKPA